MSKTSVRVIVKDGVADVHVSPGVHRIEVIDLDTPTIDWECVACHEEFSASQLKNLYSIEQLACPICGEPVNQF